MTKEKLSEVQLKNRLMSMLVNIVKAPYEIDTEVPIPYKHIYIPTDNKTKLEIWCFKQDITIYKPLFDKTIRQKESKIIKDKDTLIEIVLEKDSSQNSHPVGLPFVILELKKGQPNTHEILTYSQKAEMIKTIFPYCQFLFIIQGNISPRTYRHGINFEEVISIRDIDDVEEMKALAKTIKMHLSIAKSKLENLTATNQKRKKILA